MLKIIYSPSPAAIETALEADRASQKADIIAALPRKTKVIKNLDGEFESMKHGLKYTDPETGMVHIDLWTKIERVEMNFDVSDHQKKYAQAFRTHYSDRAPRGRKLTQTAL